MFFSLNLRKAKKPLCLLCLFLTGVFAASLVFKMLFPVKHLDIINKYCEMYQIPPSLMCAMINTESKFKEDAVSNKEATGLMQIRRITADWGAEEIGIENYDYSRIHEPELNIHIGAWYISKLIDQYGHTDTALAAYNAGSGTVSGWLGDYRYSLDGIKLSKIPYPETENYVKKINLYRFVYEIILKYKLY